MPRKQPPSSTPNSSTPDPDPNQSPWEVLGRKLGELTRQAVPHPLLRKTKPTLAKLLLFSPTGDQMAIPLPDNVTPEQLAQIRQEWETRMERNENNRLSHHTEQTPTTMTGPTSERRDEVARKVIASGNPALAKVHNLAAKVAADKGIVLPTQQEVGFSGRELADMMTDGEFAGDEIKILRGGIRFPSDPATATGIELTAERPETRVERQDRVALEMAAAEPPVTDVPILPTHTSVLTEQHEVMVRLRGRGGYALDTDLYELAVATTRAEVHRWCEAHDLEPLGLARIEKQHADGSYTVGFRFDVVVGKGTVRPADTADEWVWSERWRYWLLKFRNMVLQENVAAWSDPQQWASILPATTTAGPGTVTPLRRTGPFPFTDGVLSAPPVTECLCGPNGEGIEICPVHD